MSAAARIAALIVAAGIGRRAAGDVAKQYVAIGGKPLLRCSIETLLRHPQIASLQVVIHPDHASLYEHAMANLAASSPRLLPPVTGGRERSDSVRAGLGALALQRPDYVLIHDAARPFLSGRVLDALIGQLTTGHAVVPALAIPDTIRRFDGTDWHEVEREPLLRIQTPQGFPFAKLRELMANSNNATDEAAVWLAAGRPLRYVVGDENLRKVTSAADIDWAKNHADRAQRTVTAMGYDVHALMPSGAKNSIRLGGIDIENAHALHGHSDADAVLHAIVDALLGSIAAGDIGSFFPPSDARWKGADSAIFIEEARAQVAARGGLIEHIDVTIIGEQPKISPHRDAMRARIAELLKLPVSHVSIKATTTEKLGFTGREEGIAAQAVASVRLPVEAV